MIGSLLALGAALCWGVADFLGGSQARRAPVLAVALISQATGLVLICGLVALRGTDLPPERELAIGLGAGVIGAWAFYGLYASLSMGSMARVAPVFGTAAVIPVIAGLVRGEDPSQLQLAGIALAILGVMLVSVERGAEPQASSGTRRALIIAVLTAMSLGTAMLFVDHVAEYDPYWAVLLMRLAGTAVLAAIALALVGSGYGGVAIRARALLLIAAVGVLDVIANALWAVAATRGLLSVIAVLGSIFPAVTALLAVIVLRESLDRVQVAGAGMTLLGSGMIAAG